MAATRVFEGADPTPTIATSDLDTDGGNVSFSHGLATKRIIASTARPFLYLLVEVRQGSAAGVGVRCAGWRSRRWSVQREEWG